MGIPPVDRAMLMCYNLINPLKEKNKNSIQNNAELELYLKGAETYPLPLDVALPIYSWSQIHQNGRFTGMMMGQQEVLEGISNPIDDMWREVQHDTVVGTYYLRIGDRIKTEKVTKKETLRTIDLLKKYIDFEDSITVSLFHLSDDQITKRTHENIKAYYAALAHFLSDNGLWLVSLWRGNQVFPISTIQFRLRQFLYSAHQYMPNEQSEAIEKRRNLSLWYDHIKGAATIMEIEAALYGKDWERQISSNAFVTLANKDKKLKNYLIYALKCSDYNSLQIDPWERDEEAQKSTLNKWITEGLKSAKKQKDPWLKRRYAFVAIRLTHYHGKSEDVLNAYDKYFGQNSEKDGLDYWAMSYAMAATKS